MKSNFALTLLAGCALGAASVSSALAAGFTETGDAGDLPATAMAASGMGLDGMALTSITGNLTLTNGTSDSDMYQIYVSNPAAFSASLTAFVPGANNFDSQLVLLTSGGLGVETDDDDPTTGAAQSTLTAGTGLSPQTAGIYYLLISGSGRYATSGGALISPNFTDGTTDQTVVQGPTGPGGGGAISGYTGSSNEAGKYVIALNGAQFVPFAVPEPSAFAFALGGVTTLALLVRARRRARSGNLPR